MVAPVQYCPRRYSWDNIAQINTLCNFVRAVLSQYRWNNITQIKTLCNVVPEAPDNNPQKKLLFNVALICSGQHCTDQNTMQCCPKGSRQHCTRKILRNVVLIFLGQHCTEKALRIFFSGGSKQKCIIKNHFQCCSDTSGTTLHRSKALCSQRGSRQHCTRNILCNVVLILPGQHYTSQNLM